MGDWTGARGVGGGWGCRRGSCVGWAVSHEAVRAEIDALVDELERGAGWSRRRVAGQIRWVRTEGLIAARVLQTTSRDLDPQLHEHIVVANLVRGKDDRWWRTLDSPRLYDTRPLASTVWGRRFRTEMTARLGGSPSGSAPVAGDGLSCMISAGSEADSVAETVRVTSHLGGHSRWHSARKSEGPFGAAAKHRLVEKSPGIAPEPS